jgi:hypothetical protein
MVLGKRIKNYKSLVYYKSIVVQLIENTSNELVKRLTACW